MEVVVVTTGATKNVQSSSQINNTNKPTPNFLQPGCPSHCPTNSVTGRKYHILRTCSP